MNKKTLNILKYTVFALIAIGLMYLVFRNTDINEIITHVRHAHFMWVLLAILAGFIAYVSRGLRWIYLLEPLGYKPSKVNSISAVTITYLTNLGLPRAGELARCTAMSRAEKIPVDKLLGTVILERVIDFIMLFGLVGLTLILQFDNILGFFDASKANGGTEEVESSNTLLYVLVAVLIFSVLVYLIFRKKLIESIFFAKVRNFWVGIKEGFKTIFQMKKKGMFILHTIIIWVMYYLMVYLSFFAIDETANLSLADGLFMMIVGGLAMVVPVPGGFGAYHGAVILGLSVLGVTDGALVYATIVHSGQTLLAIVAGLIAVLLLYLYRKNKPDHVTT